MPGKKRWRFAKPGKLGTEFDVAVETSFEQNAGDVIWIPPVASWRQSPRLSDIESYTQAIPQPYPGLDAHSVNKQRCT